MQEEIPSILPELGRLIGGELGGRAGGRAGRKDVHSGHWTREQGREWFQGSMEGEGGERVRRGMWPCGTWDGCVTDG